MLAINTRPITKYSYFNYRENDDVKFKFDFAAQPAFTGCDVTLLDGPNKKMCRALWSVLPCPWDLSMTMHVVQMFV